MFSLRYKQRPEEMAGGWPGALNTQGDGERTELLVRRKLREDLMLFQVPSDSI